MQDVQEMSPLLSLKTLESVYMHCELGKSLSCHFTYRHAYCVTKASWHRTQNLPFTLWPPSWNMYYSSRCPPFYLKRFVRGKDNVKLIPFDQFQSLIVDSDAILRSLLFHFKQLDCCCVLSREARLRHKKWVHECWESVYNILPSAALLYVDTCFKMWCISLYLSVLDTLCSSSS